MFWLYKSDEKSEDIYIIPGAGGRGLDKIILVFCSLVSCIISINILFQFMNERYVKSFENKWLYLSH